MLLNSKITVFLENSQILIFDIGGDFINEKNLKFQISSLPIIVNKKIIFLDNKNKLVMMN